MSTDLLKKCILLQMAILATSPILALGKQPNIVFIMADDMGWNDVGFHGSGQIPTPNIDALAYSGLILNNYYVTAICTPSRSALMTGKHPIHTGMQHTVLFGAEPRGLPLSERLLPQYLRGLGYITRIVGKWHLGNYKQVYTPTQRGFDSHLGFWTGHQDYFDHTAVENPSWGLDMRRGLEVAWDLHGKYSTDVFTDEAVRLIQTHNTSVPLFLYVAHAAVHSGNPYNPLPVPDEAVERVNHVKDYKRRRFTAMMTKLDDSVGAIVDSLRNCKMLENSIIVFTTDNGGPAAGFNLNAASNWPLRGVKNTLWEGGVRGAALLWSPLITERQRVADQLMHITDWLPTLYAAAGGNSKPLNEIDGLNLWDALSKNTESERKEILHNIDDIYGNAAITVGEWKLLKGTTYNGAWDNWYGPSGREDEYNIQNVMNSKAGRAVTSVGCGFTAQDAISMREKANVRCNKSDKDNACQLLKAPCLFNIRSDPCELNNLANELPGIVKHLEKSLAEWNSTAIPPGNLPLDPRGDPRYWDHTWTNFGDKTILKNVVN